MTLPLPLSPQIVNEKCILDRPSNFSNLRTTSNLLIQLNPSQSKNLANLEPVFETNVKDISTSSYRNTFAQQSVVPITNLTPGSLESNLQVESMLAFQLHQFKFSNTILINMKISQTHHYILIILFLIRMQDNFIFMLRKIRRKALKKSIRYQTISHRIMSKKLKYIQMK